ncbi:ATP-binding protein [Lutibacter sp.]|uniref:ATP-binding protein n=1 Tax=Lutibacter sp. TaxID=1925666 RepID=UPI0027358BFB|nr:ATP-binding protein [Lutibacter sp.]MDP3314139.1 ATP-binding protein [Lutibacter sp.]
MIYRSITENIISKIGKGKAIILIGPRQVGKTTLLNAVLKDKNFLFLDGDDPTVRNLLTNPNTETLKSIMGTHQFVFIDEAQRIENIGLTLKIVTDQFKQIQLFVSGSSAFDINNRIRESLTGRKWEFNLFPITWKEFESYFGFLRSEQQLELRLLYGMYPDVVVNTGEEFEILKNLVNSYLYKDVLAYAGIRKPEILEKLLQALALQMGSEVSYNELSKLLRIDKNTVSSYIDILEQSFVIFKLPSFSKNIRNEIKMNKKIYFYDNGIRNMIIGNFNALDIRTDKGALWENFLISERFKINSYNNVGVKSFFWRTTQQQEIDYVETIADEINAYEFKWSSSKKVKLPKPFKENYKGSFNLITKSNFRDFIS